MSHPVWCLTRRGQLRKTLEDTKPSRSSPAPLALFLFESDQHTAVQMQFRLFSFALIVLNCMEYSSCQAPSHRWRRNKRGTGRLNLLWAFGGIVYWYGSSLDNGESGALRINTRSFQSLCMPCVLSYHALFTIAETFDYSKLLLNEQILDIDSLYKKTHFVNLQAFD